MEKSVYIHFLVGTQKAACGLKENKIIEATSDPNKATCPKCIKATDYLIWTKEPEE
jgi:hypothetical protein